MTDVTDEIEIVNKIVVNVDICSSSHIIEDLLKTYHIKIWRDILVNIKDYLTSKSPTFNAEIYKFVGDGWIILFDKQYSATNTLDFVLGIHQQFTKYYMDDVFTKLDTPPDIFGVTIGIDEGQLIKMTMQDKIEYIGRPINMACRLQGTINDIDIKGGYRIFMSHRLYHDLKTELLKYNCEPTERPLRNIGDGRRIKCYRIAINDDNFRIVHAIYGTQRNNIDVTFQYIKYIRNNKLDVIVSNEIAENDPDFGIPKILKIVYAYAGKSFTREFKEGSRIQLP